MPESGQPERGREVYQLIGHSHPAKRQRQIGKRRASRRAPDQLADSQRSVPQVERTLAGVAGVLAALAGEMHPVGAGTRLANPSQLTRTQLRLVWVASSAITENAVGTG
jgi:hypothetical protein